jgi:hypothetical protein
MKLGCRPHAEQKKIWEGAANPPALDDGGSSAGSRHVPSQQFTTLATARVLG